ncbi:hypothetical protein [Corynebacterium pyruviciproducens]|uniref:Uncharacterized protein n=1 Tax=Corynebacterium pyruviciproducens TaxID=598660 RepID=A0AAF0YXX9_9CORY|nr:hypothetical protein [Corynebacterium pyruviciproducens]WOT02565.1 hypothetical protein CYJ47_01980 [Corynebacterium pyruviciproducens]
MAKVKVIAPVEGYVGRIGNDVFVDGVAEVEKEAVDYYLRHGYEVEGEGNETAEKQTVPSAERVANEAEIHGENVRPASGDTKAEWVAYADKLGIGTKGMNKADIMDACAEHEKDGRNVDADGEA